MNTVVTFALKKEKISRKVFIHADNSQGVSEDFALDKMNFLF